MAQPAGPVVQLTLLDDGEVELTSNTMEKITLYGMLERAKDAVRGIKNNGLVLAGPGAVPPAPQDPKNGKNRIGPG